ncbi:MAG TPA: PDZ domain-containing protein [Bryobacteraceae bacterium]|nr:PDZ domain-containing protein [Bryobacteraceae bacterium]
MTASSLAAQSLAGQSFAFFQAPGGTQVYEFHTGGQTYLGVNIAEVNADRAHELKLRDAYGVEITRVEEGSPAEKAGLKSGDVVLEYNGQRVEGMEQFGRMVRETPSGREVKLLVSRGGTAQTVSAVLGTHKMKPMIGNFPGVELPEIHLPDIPQIFTAWRSPMLGVEAEALGPQLAAYFGVKDGVLVRSVVKESAAEKGGIKAGDVITKIDGAPVTTPNEVSGAVRSATSKKTFAVDLVREHHDMSISINVEDISQRELPATRAVHN